MLEGIKKLLTPGILSRYSRQGGPVGHPLYTLTPGQCRKTLRPVLIKTYTEEGAQIEDKFDRAYRARALSEILPELRHDALARTVEAGFDGHRRVEILEDFRAPTLRELLDSHKLTPETLRRVVEGLGAGLEYLHENGYIHRGLRPQAAAVGEGGQVRIMDLSLLMDTGMARRAGTVTAVGPYSAPEIIRRHPIDERSDVFSLGAIIYEAICGAPLFPNTGGFERMVRVMNSKPLELSARNAHVGDELESVVMRAVAKDPHERYGSVAELLEAFSSVELPERLGSHHSPAFAA